MVTITKKTLTALAIVLLLALVACTTMRQEIRQPDGTVKITEYTGGLREAKEVNVRIGADTIRIKSATIDVDLLIQILQAIGSGAIKAP